MRQLTGLDSAFLNLENATGHDAGLSSFARPDTSRCAPYVAWKEQLEQRLHLLEPLRRWLAEVPLGLDHPFWINDPNFDLEFHVRHTAVPPPGSDEQLANVVGRIVARPLDRRRPLWLSYVIERLANDRFAVLTVLHPRGRRRRVRDRAADADARRHPGRAYCPATHPLGGRP
jgi:diacylglycerol O-acyltransferase